MKKMRVKRRIFSLTHRIITKRAKNESKSVFGDELMKARKNLWEMIFYIIFNRDRITCHRAFE